MASGVGSGDLSAWVGGVRLGGLGAVGRGSCLSAPVSFMLQVRPVGVICGLGGFDFDGGGDLCRVLQGLEVVEDFFPGLCLRCRLGAGLGLALGFGGGLGCGVALGLGCCFAVVLGGAWVLGCGVAAGWGFG